MSYLIRPARPSDAESCARVYAPCTAMLINFEYSAPDGAEMARRITETMRDYPWLICEKDGEVIGYAYAHRFRTRPAYDWDAELSIYLDRSATGAGIGPALYSALLELLRLQNYVNVYGAVSIPNPPSERLHEKLGFERVAVFRRTGRKLGEWRDLAFYHIVLNDYAASPAEVIPFPALAPEAVLRACAEGAARLNK